MGFFRVGHRGVDGFCESYFALGLSLAPALFTADIARGVDRSGVWCCAAVRFRDRVQLFPQDIRFRLKSIHLCLQTVVCGAQRRERLLTFLGDSSHLFQLGLYGFYFLCARPFRRVHGRAKCFVRRRASSVFYWRVVARLRVAVGAR